MSPVLLLGAGTGEATCGILYLAGYLRRHGIESYVRLWDGDESPAEVRRSLEALLARVKPRLVGISFKWFHHVHRALLIARTIRRIDRSIRIVFGGNSASYFWRELARFDCVDHVAMGDGEQPLLGLCRGEPLPPNVVSRSPEGEPRRLPLTYVQGPLNSEDVFYSHFDQIFLSQMDVHAFSGWVAPGKGCGENCLYCGGARGNQKADFGRAKPFLRAEESVRRDHAEIAPRTWQMRYDFSGSSARFLGSTWAGVDLSRHACTYFLWGRPPVDLVQALAHAFERVFMVLDVGCFSQTQRREQIRRGLLKPCLDDDELVALIHACQRFPNLEVEVSGIAGLPFATKATLDEELALAQRVIDLGCIVGSQRLEAQPGALVTAHPDRFGMMSEAQTFDEFLRFFERREPGDNSVPMIRFKDAALEAAVQRTSDRIDALAGEHAANKRHVALSDRTQLKDTSPSRIELSLEEWFGSHRAPAAVASERVTVVRSLDGTGLVCAPTVSARRFADPTLAHGEDARILLETLRAFADQTSVGRATAKLREKSRIDPETTRAAIEHLVEGRFLRPL